MKTLIKKHSKTGIGILVGAVLGYSYYYFIGCSSGTCAITSSPIISTLYGGMMGGLLMSSFNKKEVKTTDNK